MEHPTKTIPIKSADIDINIIPIIRWMNSFPGIYTRYSCEGDYPLNDYYGQLSNEARKPYVSWLCFDNKDRDKVLQKLDGYSTTEITVDEIGQLKYCTRFTDKIIMDMFKETWGEYKFNIDRYFELRDKQGIVKEEKNPICTLWVEREPGTGYMAELIYSDRAVAEKIAFKLNVWPKGNYEDWIIKDFSKEDANLPLDEMFEELDLDGLEADNYGIYSK